MPKISTILGLAAFGGTMTLAVSTAHADAPPPAVTAMIDAAAATGDAATLKSVVDMAKKTNPNSVAEIDAEVARLATAAEKARVEKLSHESFFQGIKGQGQIGFSDTTGNTDSLNLAVGLNLSKETLHWKNTIDLAADYQRANGVTSDERFLASYEADYKFNARLYAVGIAGWDRDTFSGYNNRYGGSLGIGYYVINQPNKITLTLEAGPAIRYTQYLSVLGAPAYNTTDGGARASGLFSWNLTPTTVFTEKVTGFVGGGDDTVGSNTAITTKLVGALSARVAFLVQYNSNPPLGLQTTDTTTTLTLVYGF